MAIRDTGQVDLVLSNADNSDWILVISEPDTVPDTEAALADLSRKIDYYVDYVRSGRFHQDYPESRGGSVRIWLRHEGVELGTRIQEYIRSTGATLKERDGIEVFAAPPADPHTVPAVPPLWEVGPDDAENPTERAFFTARLANAFTEATRLLTRAVVWVPLTDGGQNWFMVGYSDRAYAAVFTSRKALLYALGGGFDRVETMPFLEVLRAWSRAEAGVAVNPNTNTLLVLPPDLIIDLLRDEAEETAKDAVQSSQNIEVVELPMEANGVRFAKVFGGMGAGGRPMVSPDGLINDPEERERLARYLSSGRRIHESEFLGTDLLGPAREPRVPANIWTDGTWVWEEAVLYYLVQYGVAPEPELRRHIQEREYQCPPVTDEQVEAVLRAEQELARLREEVLAQTMSSPAQMPLPDIFDDVAHPLTFGPSRSDTTG